MPVHMSTDNVSIDSIQTVTWQASFFCQEREKHFQEIS